MNKVKLFFAALFAVTFAGLALSQPVLATTYEDASSANTDLYNAAQTFSTDMQSAGASDDVDAAKVAVQDFQQAAADAESAFTQVANDAKDKQAKEYVTRLATAADAMSTSAGNLVQALETGDQDAYAEAATAFQAAANDYDDASLAYQNYIAAHPNEQGDPKYFIFLSLFILSCVLLVGSAVFAVVMNKKHSNKKLKERRNQMVLGAVLAVIGTGVLFFSFNAAASNPDGGTYYIPYWGFIGLILFVIGVVAYLVDYFKLKKAGALSVAPAASMKIKDVAPQADVSSDPTKPLVK